MRKPQLFIGSSGEGLNIARAVEAQLEQDAEVTVWRDGVFGLGEGTLEALVNSLDKFDFAVLILTPDDMTTSRSTTTQSPRDNVLLELGMFIGRLGRERTFAVFNRDKNVKLPRDLAGVTIASYGERQDGNVIAALGPACTKIRNSIQQLGTIVSLIPTQILPANGAVFNHYPRWMTLMWSDVPGVEHYFVEIQAYVAHGADDKKRWITEENPGRVLERVYGNIHTFFFIGAQPGRWRVWGVYPSGEEGPKSEWSHFSHTR